MARTEPTGVHDIVDSNDRAGASDNLDAVLADLYFLDACALPKCRAVLNGDRRKLIVAVLTVEMELVSIGFAWDDGLETVSGIMHPGLGVVEIAEVPLHPARHSDLWQKSFGAVEAKLRHVIKLGHGAKRFRGFQDHRLADGEAGVLSGFEDHDAQAMPSQDRRQGGTRNSRSEDRDIEIRPVR